MNSVFTLNIFPTPKKDGTCRVILNLKELNPFVRYEHFKLDSITDVINLIHPMCFFVTIDFKDAYFSVSVTPEERKWLRFRWKGQHFQFTCLPQGLTSAPRIFTKLLKPVLAHLRKLGITVCCYLDDCIFIGASEVELIENVRYAVFLFDSLGLTVNVKKSVLDPTREIEFLGVLFNSVNMTATLPQRKKDCIKDQGISLLKEDISLHSLASFIGLTVAAAPAVSLAPLRYKYLEIVRNQGLNQNFGNYNAKIVLDDHSRELIIWWINNVDSLSRSLLSCPPQLELHTDACLTGWGASVGELTTGGHWAHEELDHINCLELKAILLGLKSLCKDYSQTHIRLRSDNTTAVACIDRGGSTKRSLNSLVEEIFTWAESRQITLSAQHIKGLDNVEADRASRAKNLDREWMLKPEIFQLLCHVFFFFPDIDLFASRINAQLPKYVSWKPDPSAFSTNAFALQWGDMNLYAFPPFRIIGKMLKKLREDKATLLTVLPLWPTQVWFPSALHLLAATPFILPPCSLILPQDPSRVHSRAQKLAAMLLSGDPLKTRAFRQRLPASSLNLGEKVQLHSMGHISRDGCQFVSAGKLIHFAHVLGSC